MTYKDNEFPYTLQAMTTPLKTPTGKIRKDRYGQPLTSLKIKQEPTDKKRMIKRLQKLAAVYAAMPEFFPEKKTYGVDPVAMSSERCYKDLCDKFEDWKIPGNDIFESFIIRHNDHVDHLKAQAMLNDPTGNDAAHIEMEYAIRKVRKRNPKMEKIINNNFQDLFEE